MKLFFLPLARWEQLRNLITNNMIKLNDIIRLPLKFLTPGQLGTAVG